MARIELPPPGTVYPKLSLLIILISATLADSTKTGKPGNVYPHVTILTLSEPTTEQPTQQNDILWDDDTLEHLQKANVHDEPTPIDKRPAIGMQHIGLGKRPSSGLRYIGLGKRPGHSVGLQYVGLGKRPTESTGSGLQYVGLGKRKPGAMGSGLQYVERANMGAGLQYTGLGKRLLQKIEHESAQRSNANSRDNFKRGESGSHLNSGFYYAGIGRRGLDKGMLYAGIGKRSRRDIYGADSRTLSSLNAAMQYAGFGKRPWGGVDAAMLYAGIGKRSTRYTNRVPYWTRRLLHATKNPRMLKNRRHTNSGAYDNLVDILEEQLGMDLDMFRDNSLEQITRDDLYNDVRFILSAMRAGILRYRIARKTGDSNAKNLPQRRTHTDMNLAMQYTGIGKRKVRQPSRIYSATDRDVALLYGGGVGAKRATGRNIRNYGASAVIDPALGLNGIGRK